MSQRDVNQRGPYVVLFILINLITMAKSGPKLSRKGSSKNDEYGRLARRKQIAHLYLQGKSQFEIGKLCDPPVTQPMVAYELKKIRKEWLASTLLDFTEAKVKEIAKIDHLEEMAWRSFHRSCEDAVTDHKEVERKLKDVVRVEKGKALLTGKTEMQVVGDVSKKITKGQAGDPRFLERVAWCIDQRCKILGIYKETTTTVNQLILNFDELYGKPTLDDDPVEKQIEVAGRVESSPSSNGEA